MIKLYNKIKLNYLIQKINNEKYILYYSCFFFTFFFLNLKNSLKNFLCFYLYSLINVEQNCMVCTILFSPITINKTKMVYLI